MGGRGATSGSRLGKVGDILMSSNPKEIYLSRDMEKNKSVVIAKVKDGKVTLRAANDELDKVEGPVGRIIVNHGIIKNKPINLNLAKAKEINGETYSSSTLIRESGFKWSKKKRVWYNDRLSNKEKREYL